MAILKNVPNMTYHSNDGHISKSGLDLIDRSPAHYYFRPKFEPSRAMEMGTALHAAILEPERYSKEYILLMDVKDRRDALYKQACAAVGTERVLVGKEADKIQGMQMAIQSNKSATGLLKSGGENELSLYTTDPITGVKVKARFDFLSNDFIALDIKKTRDIRDFAKTIFNYRYHVQAAFYSDVFLWDTGQKLNDFRFLAVEEDFPHANRVFIPDSEMMEIGRKLYRENLNTYAECLNKNEWPGVVLDDEVISLPYWAVDQNNDVEIIIGDDNE